jgi:hypothetical protein
VAGGLNREVASPVQVDGGAAGTGGGQFASTHMHPSLSSSMASSPGGQSSASTAGGTPEGATHRRGGGGMGGGMGAGIGPLAANPNRRGSVLGGKKNQQGAIVAALGDRTLRIRALGWEKHLIGKSHRTHYVFEVYAGGAMWQISRRFSHFSVLDDHLRADAMGPRQTLPELPSKGTFTTKDRAFKAQRTHALEAYLVALGTMVPVNAAYTRFLHEGREYS